MSGRDYKPSPEKPKNTKKGSPFLTGLLIGQNSFGNEACQQIF
jgi:hypothetical protein